MRGLILLGAIYTIFRTAITQPTEIPEPCDGGSCHPDTGDLLVGREDRLFASSTCGQNGPEKYCIVSHLKDEEKCFTCDANGVNMNHNIENVITTFRKRLETWWQSENGVDKVSIRLDLETVFHFTHLIMTFKTFRPASMLIERSNDYGKSWKVYRHFAYDCSEKFPELPQFPPREIDELICDSRYSLIEPSTEGEVIYKVLEPSLIPFDDPYSTRIQDLLTITNLRINFTHMHTLGDDLLDTRKNIKDKYYYSLYELIVRGNCFCYGHADECRPIDASLERPDLIRRDLFQVNGKCVCQHNTHGLNCNECFPFYHDQPWRPAYRGQSNECKRCNCNYHADECHFDQAVWEANDQRSGGVCDGCRDHTMGQHCELCVPGFYHHPDRDIRDPNVCEVCDCEVTGSANGGMCDSHNDPEIGMIAGQCHCKEWVDGERCDRCKPGYYNLDESNDYGCTACDCASLGTLDGTSQCDQNTGQCICKRHTIGRRCEQCAPQTWGLSAENDGCSLCLCDAGGSYDNDCDPYTGQCNCRSHVIQRPCNIAEDGFFVPFLDHYAYEAEDADGNEYTFRYNQKFAPPMMWTGYGFRMIRGNGVITFTVSGLPTSMEYDFFLRYVPYTERTVEDVRVSIVRPNAGNILSGSPCDNIKPGDDQWVSSLNGHPTTFENLGSHCLEAEYTYIIRFEFPGGVDGVNIDSLVLVANYSGISIFHGSIAGAERSREFDKLHCLDQAIQLPKQQQHDVCAYLVFSMNAIIHDGALACNCDPQGSLSSICDKNGGRCQCKSNVMGRRCDKCVPGTFGLGPDGCRHCYCNTKGSITPDVQYCDTKTGQCTCTNGDIGGRQCDRCRVGFYKFPECRPCDCNGHTNYCEQQTGVCMNCQDNTVGEHCERCDDGYYGDPTLGSQDQCKPCMCPGGPDSGRQFAETCSEYFNPHTNSNQVVCDCLPQYTGETCNQCAAGHYGNPHEVGGQCIACDCNGNVDPTDPNACNAHTGECTACLHDTAGPRCEICRGFFYGNALTRDCRLCACDNAGTDPAECIEGHCHCNMNTGQCLCLPNMTGRRCESCLPNHFRGENGCRSCYCHPLNSLGGTCDEYTGQCLCKDGFGGHTCGDCADGFWGNPNDSCFECNCGRVGSVDLQCDRVTGQCQCIEGVGGRYCDRCERGYTGDIPRCEPCGECFDNWDSIISDLKDRTEKAIAKAQSIKNTGITGAYEEDFTEIEGKLKEIETIIQSLKDGAANDNFRDTIDGVRDRFTTQQHLLNKLEKDMARLYLEDTNINQWLDERKEAFGGIRGKMEGLKEEKKSISKSSSEAAYKQVFDAAQRSENAELAAKAATTEPGSLVEQSQQVRAEVKLTFASKQEDFAEKREQVEDDLSEYRAKVDDLSLAKLNENVCGVATEDCDETCGGAGCEHCGGLSCNDALTNAEEAKARAEKTKEILQNLTADAADLHLTIQAAKKSATHAKRIAQNAKDKKAEVDSLLLKRNSRIREIIRRIREFLTDERAKPEEVEKLAREILAMSLTADKDEIDDLSEQIRQFVDSLPDVDNLLKDTQDDLDRANELLDAAKQAEVNAAAVANDVRAVLGALEKAENASLLATAARDKAHVNIDFAVETINEIVMTASKIQSIADGFSSEVTNLETKLSDIEQKITGNGLMIEQALQTAESAKDLGRITTDVLKRNEDVIKEGNGTLNKKKVKVDRLQKLTGDAEALRTEVKDNLNKLNTLNNKFDQQERDLNAKSDELDVLLVEVEGLHSDIMESEASIRLCN